MGTKVIPPRVFITIGGYVKMKGYCTSCSVNWKKPVRDGRFVFCTVTLDITETLSISFSADEVFTMDDMRRYAYYSSTRRVPPSATSPSSAPPAGPTGKT